MAWAQQIIIDAAIRPSQIPSFENGSVPGDLHRVGLLSCEGTSPGSRVKSKENVRCGLGPADRAIQLSQIPPSEPGPVPGDLHRIG